MIRCPRRSGNPVTPGRPQPNINKDPDKVTRGPKIVLLIILYFCPGITRSWGYPTVHLSPTYFCLTRLAAALLLGQHVETAGYWCKRTDMDPPPGGGGGSFYHDVASEYRMLDSSSVVGLRGSGYLKTCIGHNIGLQAPGRISISLSQIYTPGRKISSSNYSERTYTAWGRVGASGERVAWGARGMAWS